MTDIFLDTEPPKKLPTMASVIHLPIPPYHSIRLKPSSSRSLSPIKSSISAQHSKNLNTAISCNPLEAVVEILIHPPFHTNYTEMTTGKTSKSGDLYYDLVAKLVARSITPQTANLFKMEIDCVTRERVDCCRMGLGLQKVSIFLLYIATSLLVSSDIPYRHLGLCIQDICGAIPSPLERLQAMAYWSSR
jgi:hypothetical protein